MKEIMDVLTKFQQGYDESNLEKADALMAEVFLKREDLLNNLWPIKLTAVVEKSADGYKFRQKHYSYSFNWYFEGLY